GLVSGTLSTWSASSAFRIDQVAQQAIEFPMGFTIIMIAMNRRAWDNLPDAAREAFERNSGEGLTATLSRIETGINDALRDRFVEGGAVIYTPEGEARAQWEAALGPIASNWAEQTPGMSERLAVLREIIADIREVEAGE
ncbi:MAG: hypothetical protein ACNA7M_11805, partial [Roseovarius sp.]